MIRLQSILAATDFSKGGRHAVERAAVLCASIGVERGAVLHVVEGSWLEGLRNLVGLPSDAEQSLETTASRSLEELIATVQAHSGVTLEPRVRTGSVSKVVLEASAEFDLLVLGAHGRHPLRDLAVGATAERILRQSRKPTLIVRRKPSGPYGRVLVGVDFSSQSRTAYASARTIAPRAEIHLLHVYEALFEGRLSYANIAEGIVKEYRTKARQFARAEMESFIGEAGTARAHLHSSIQHGTHVPTKLRDSAREIGADLVVVGKHGRSLTEDVLLGSVTLHLLAESPCDILVTQ